MDITQQLDQLGAMLRDVAPLLYNYYKDLQALGFTEEQAFAMVKDYQTILLTAK